MNVALDLSIRCNYVIATKACCLRLGCLVNECSLRAVYLIRLHSRNQKALESNINECFLPPA